jgi:hypothetical protein
VYSVQSVSSQKRRLLRRCEALRVAIRALEEYRSLSTPSDGTPPRLALLMMPPAKRAKAKKVSDGPAATQPGRCTDPRREFLSDGLCA